MGWGNCGLDSQGRSIGYVHVATCDHPNCDEIIDRGLSYACGGMHGEGSYSCEKYFCHKHLGLPSWDEMYDGYEDLKLDMSDVVHYHLAESEHEAHICEECREAFVQFVREYPEQWAEDVEAIVTKYGRA